MDLGLHHELSSAQSRGDGLGLGGSIGNLAGLGCDAEFGEKFTGLEFVDIHEGKVISLSNYTSPFSRESSP
jgi:hypothetical protein